MTPKRSQDLLCSNIKQSIFPLPERHTHNLDAERLPENLRCLPTDNKAKDKDILIIILHHLSLTYLFHTLCTLRRNASTACPNHTEPWLHSTNQKGRFAMCVHPLYIFTACGTSSSPQTHSSLAHTSPSPQRTLPD